MLVNAHSSYYVLFGPPATDFKLAATVRSSQQTTVREALVISAVLRLTHTRDRGLIEAFADEVMALTELGAQRDALVGQPGLFGLSLEQRKRLTIGVELVANPRCAAPHTRH